MKHRTTSKQSCCSRAKNCKRECQHRQYWEDWVLVLKYVLCHLDNTNEQWFIVWHTPPQKNIIITLFPNFVGGSGLCQRVHMLTKNPEELFRRSYTVCSFSKKSRTICLVEFTKFVNWPSSFKAIPMHLPNIEKCYSCNPQFQAPTKCWKMLYF